MKNWFDIIPPHEDIRKGHFDEAIFAADLGDVAAGVAPQDYNDPYLFFTKTYLTRGLQNLLTRVEQKLTAGQGASVVEIQTPFGGGKTHALVAIYHYLTQGERVRSLLPPGLDLVAPRVSVISGDHWNPLEGRTTEDVTRHTFWGEIAYQIGGREGYESFRANDEARVSPGKEKLRAFLEAHQPFVLLFDEILEYINRAQAVRSESDVALSTQTFSFFQELTEAVATLPHGMLVVTLPSSYLEDFGERQEESLARLNKIFGRVESIETPVQGEEVYAVIRRRLFEVERLKAGAMQGVIHEYFQAYQEHHDDLSPKARDLNYRQKMELAYPFHPDVIDILYEKWSTFSSFQRTRGVLRLLANVVEDLYQREVNLDLILPGDLNLEKPSVRQEFLRHLGSEYEGIIGSDIAGHEAKAQQLDDANRNWKHLAQRVATAIFFHSFSADPSAPGVTLPYVKLAVMRSDTLPAMVTEVLHRLSNTLWYLNARGEAYYFSRVPNLNRMILDKKELYNQSYESRLREVIAAEVGNKFASYLWPESGDGIPDNRKIKLVILHPEQSWNDVQPWLEGKGSAFREYPNTLIFALADTGAFAKLKEDVKTVLALEEIAAEIDAGTSPLPEEKRTEIRQRKGALTRDFSYHVRRMYHRLHTATQEIDLGTPTVGNESLSSWYWRELASEDYGVIVTQLHYRLLANKLLAESDAVPTAVVLDQFYKNPQLPLPAQPEVVARAIQLGVEEQALGLIETREEESDLETLKFGTRVPLEVIDFGPGQRLLSRERSAALQAELEAQRAPVPGGDETQPPPERTGPTITPPVRPDQGGPGPGPTPPTPEKRYHHLRLTITGVPAGRIGDVNRGVFLPLSNLVDDGLTFTLELDVTSAEGIPEATLEQKVKETVRQIGARVVREEKG
ncbi:MAG: ATP-binding protein [Anaerolineales bacterium]